MTASMTRRTKPVPRRQAGTEEGAGKDAQGHGDAVDVENLAPPDEEDEGRHIAHEVEDLGIAGSRDEVEAQGRKADDEESPRPRPDEAVIETDGRGHDQGGQDVLPGIAAVRAGSAELTLAEDEDRRRDEGDDDDGLEPFALQVQHDQAAQDGADEGPRQDPLQEAHVDLAGPPELPGAHDGAKGRGKFIGPNGQVRRQAGCQEDGQRDEAATAGNGIDETGQEAAGHDEEQQRRRQGRMKKLEFHEKILLLEKNSSCFAERNRGDPFLSVHISSPPPLPLSGAAEGGRFPCR